MKENQRNKKREKRKREAIQTVASVTSFSLPSQFTAATSVFGARGRLQRQAQWYLRTSGSKREDTLTPIPSFSCRLPPVSRDWLFFSPLFSMPFFLWS